MIGLIRTTLLLALLTIIFYWKILLTSQFTILRQWATIGQGYGWLNFALQRIRAGHLPLWDPYTFGGHSFLGEMQTSGLSPLNLVLALVPPNTHGLLPVMAYNVLFAFLHFLGLAFGYALARELRLKTIHAVVTGLCFSMGGYLVRILEWPHLIQSGIWLPLVMLLLIRALRSRMLLNQVYYAALTGMVIGLAILGGGLQLVIMQVIVVVTATAFYAWQGGLDDAGTESAPKPLWPRLQRAVLLVAVVGGITAGAGAFQLFPSYSYAPKAYHYIESERVLASEQIPYSYLNFNYALPDSIVSFVMPVAFNGNMQQLEFLEPYIGFLPFLLAIYGMIRRWDKIWVRYFAFLALGSTLYTFGPFSPLHGMLYALVPKLWWVRVPARLSYLSSFSLAVLAGYGMDALFQRETAKDTNGAIRFFDRILQGLVLVCAAILLFGSAFVKEVNAWIQLSCVLIFLSYGVYRAAGSGRVGRFAQAFALFLVVFDLASFDWVPQTKIDVEKSDAYLKLLSSQNAARFLKSLPGPFRVHIDMPEPPAIGDAFNVLTINGTVATLMRNYAEMLGRPDLLDVEYVMKESSASDPNPIYQDAGRKIFRAPKPAQHAWIVHKVIRVHGEFDGDWYKNSDLRTATTVDSLESQVDPGSADGESVKFTGYTPDLITLDVSAKGRALLVLSEIYDPDWNAKLNGQPITIHQVDGGLRGILIPGGQSHIEMEYHPFSVVAGGVLTIFTFLGMAGFWIHMRRRQNLIESPQALRTDGDNAVLLKAED